MKKLDHNLPHPHDLDEGWIVHIYGNNRRLLCTLNPSHGWSMVAGLVLGIGLTASCTNLNNATPASNSATQPMQAPLSVD